MEDFKSRLKEETQELIKKLHKLQDFMGSEKFYKLPRIDKDLLYDQYHAMLTYLQILGKRCERLEVILDIPIE